MPTSSPTIPYAASFAPTTLSRRGVTRNCQVIVWWRFSPAMPRTPRIRAKT
ncbi:hypothetical protein [Streptosporangium sp. NPDC049644]|uniref:hypothetical protein n=1 Tax=Streptosporangium sp. NPDC049644 TaxID=3155507 RepID=UPI0034309DAA